MSSISRFHAPRTVDEAVRILRECGEEGCVLAGGTDLMVRSRRGMLPPSLTTLVSVHRIATMSSIRRENGEIVVGAAVTATGLIRDPVVAEHAPILATVADRMASPQIRNVATIGGNLANASPSGDLISPLILLDASLLLVSAGGTRTIPVESFFTGPGETVLEQGEMIVEARFAEPGEDRTFRFEKAGTRPAMECSFVTVGLAYDFPDGAYREVRVSFGSVAPTPLRGHGTEGVLEGRRPSPELAARAAEKAREEISPISDVRGSDCYRRDLTAVFIRRMVEEEIS